MIEHIPFLPNSEGDTDILGRSLNELSHLSRVLSFLVHETNQYKLQLDFLLLVHLVLQTAFDPDERLDTEEQLANRLRNRFKRHITDEFVQQVLYQMRSAGWVDKTKQDGIRITNAGIRMGTLLLDMVQRNYVYHEKDDLQKEIFIAELSSLNLETSRKLRMDSMPNFLQLLNSVHRMTELVQRNIPYYIQKENALNKDVTPTLDEEYDYRRLCEDNFSQITLGDCLPIFRLLYQGKFSEAVQQEYMPSFDDFMKLLNLESQEIIEDQKYTQGCLVINHPLRQLRTMMMRPIKESAVKDYDILRLEFEKNMRDKQRLEEELVSFRSIVESDYRTVEGIITSSIRAISERLNEVIASMNYTVQLEYRNKEEGGGHRRLIMWFKKTHEQQMRVVTERGGLSGGEHAIVSLMMMYSILSIKEEKKMEGKSGGYLLLDEWDANLDPLKAQTVFQVLKKLRKKIISITPRSSSRKYLSEFGLLLRVINTPSRHGIVVLKERTEEALNEFFAELEEQEEKTDKVLA